MYDLIAGYVYGTPWAILPAKLAVILEALEFRRAGGVFTPEEIRARVGAGRDVPQPYQVALAAAAPASGARGGGVVQVLPMFGTLAHRANLMTEDSGGTSTERFTRQFRAALQDPEVAAIVLDVDSPGGAVDGVPELADEVFRARGQKPVVAAADTLAASAAYWIATSASEVFVSPSGEVGSIGVFAAHDDVSRSLDSEGVTRTLISAGKFKVEGNPYEPLGEEARAAIQGRVDDYYGMFVRSVARGRGVSAEDVRSGFGEGRVVGARQAVEMKMADRVGTLDEAIARAAQMARQMKRAGGRAEGDARSRAVLAGL